MGSNTKKFDLVRDRVTATTYGSNGTLLIRNGVIKAVCYHGEKHVLSFTCESESIEIPGANLLNVEVKSIDEILIQCKSFVFSISGEDATIELSQILQLMRRCFYSVEDEPVPSVHNNDIQGYYSILGVQVECSQDDIKKAYRQRCLEVHPDVNKSEGANELFLHLQTAYEILSDSCKRAKYDSECVNTPTHNHQTSASNSNSEDSFEPIKCSICNCVTAQPRYVVFWETVSFFSTVRSPIQGIMCVKCAGKIAFEATRKSLIFGWWGIWGVIFTPMSVIGNIAGGETPAENNARILLHQSWYFVQNERPDLAYFLAIDAKKYLSKCSASGKVDLLSLCDQIIDNCKSFAHGKELDSIWERSLPKVVDQFKAVGLCAVIGIFGIAAINSYVNDNDRKLKEGAPIYSYKQPQKLQQEAPILPPLPVTPENTVQSMPSISEVYLPLSTGYIPNKAIGNDTGYSSVTLHNNSDRNFHVKLYKNKNSAWFISRELYLKAGQKFEMSNLDPGKYEIRRLDVQSKFASKSEPFILEELRESDGVRHSVFTLRFNAVNGNSKIIPINAIDF